MPALQGPVCLYAAVVSSVYTGCNRTNQLRQLYVKGILFKHIMFRKFSRQRHCVIEVILISGQNKVITSCLSVLNQHPRLLVLNKHGHGASLVLLQSERYCY